MPDTTIKGLAALQAALDTLPAKVEANIARAAMRAGAKVIWKEAKARVPERTGLLAKSLKFSAKLDRRAGACTARVRAGGRGKKGQPQAYYAHMVEFGTAAHVIKARPGSKGLNVGGLFYTSVLHPGARKQPFLRLALDAKATAAVLAVAEYMRRRLATKYGLDVPAPVDPEAEPDE